MPHDASDGGAFENLCRNVWLQCFGQTLTPCLTQDAQFTIGDTYEGVEFKELRGARNYLHMEFAERTSAASSWVESGIYRRHSASRYMCGHDREIFLFSKADLVSYHRSKSPTEVAYGWNRLTLKWEKDNPEVATIRSFILERSIAIEICLNRFWRAVVGWRVEPSPTPRYDPYFDERGTFCHPCSICGDAYAPFGYGYFPPAKLGEWFCRGHRPGEMS